MADKKISALTASSLPLAGTEVLPIVQSGATVKVAVDDLTVKNIRSNATTGILQVAGPAAAATRTMTTPDANFSAARIDAGQTFTGAQNLENGSGTNQRLLYLKQTNDFGYSFNIDSVSTGDLTLKSVNSGVEANIFKASRASGTVTFADNVVIGTAGKGIDFSANTHAAGMTSELLNWYEEGTWTPNQGSGLTVVGAFSSTGRYTRIGRQVTVTGQVSGATSVLVNASGVISTNLPFASGVDTLGIATNSALSVVGGVFVSSGSANLFATVAIGATPTIYFQVTYFV